MLNKIEHRSHQTVVSMPDSVRRFMLFSLEFFIARAIVIWEELGVKVELKVV